MVSYQKINTPSLFFYKCAIFPADREIKMKVTAFNGSPHDDGVIQNALEPLGKKRISGTGVYHINICIVLRSVNTP
jgi:hypothetical protein